MTTQAIETEVAYEAIEWQLSLLVDDDVWSTIPVRFQGMWVVEPQESSDNRSVIFGLARTRSGRFVAVRSEHQRLIDLDVQYGVRTYVSWSHFDADAYAGLWIPGDLYGFAEQQMHALGFSTEPDAELVLDI